MKLKIFIIASIVCLQGSLYAVIRSPYPEKTAAPIESSGAGHEIVRFDKAKKV